MDAETKNMTFLRLSAEFSMNLGLDITRLITEKILARKTVQYWYYHETEEQK